MVKRWRERRLLNQTKGKKKEKVKYRERSEANVGNRSGVGRQSVGRAAVQVISFLYLTFRSDTHFVLSFLSLFTCDCSVRPNTEDSP